MYLCSSFFNKPHNSNMARNREQLLQTAAKHAKQLKGELSRALGAFMTHANLRPSDISRMLGIDENVVNNMLQGSGVIDIDTLAVLLVSMGLAVEVKPIGATPLQTYGEGGGRSGGRPLPPYGEEPMGVQLGAAPHPSRMPNRDERGRFSRRVPVAGEGMPLGVPKPATRPQYNDVPNAGSAHESEDVRGFVSSLDSSKTSELKELIAKNLWDGEIDVNNASREELISFLADKAARKAAYDNARNAQPVHDVHAERPMKHEDFRPVGVGEGVDFHERAVADAPVERPTHTEDYRRVGGTEVPDASVRTAHSEEALDMFDKLFGSLRSAMQQNPTLAEQVGSFLRGK